MAKRGPKKGEHRKKYERVEEKRKKEQEMKLAHRKGFLWDVTTDTIGQGDIL